MGMHGDYKINECGEIIRNEPYQSQKPNQEPEKKRKGGWIVWLIVMSIAAYFGYEMYRNNSISNNSVDDHGSVNVNGEYYNSNNSNNNYAYNNSQSRQSTLRSYNLSGNIGSSLRITMILDIHGDGSCMGWYYYDKYGPGNKLHLSGSNQNGMIVLYECNSDGVTTGKFEGYISSDTFSGNFVAYHSGKNYNFRLNY